MKMNQNNQILAKENLEKAIIGLLNNYPFYGFFLNGCRRIFTDNDKDMPTCGVNVTDKVNLYINNNFWNSLTKDEREGILQHEVDHIINLHMLRCENKDNKTFNEAADIAINQYIDPKKVRTGLFPHTITKVFGIKVLEKMPAEYYYEILKNEKEKNKNKQGNEIGDTLDNHNIWEKGEKNQEAVEQIVKASAKNAMDKAKAIGNLPGNLEGILNELFKPKINWKQQLKQFIQASLKYNKESSRKKRNKRYGIIYAGKKKTDLLRIYIAVDTSGSVSDNELTQFFSEVNDMVAKNLNLTIKILIADSQIQDTFEYKKNMKIPIKGRGGTAYQPAIEYTNNTNEHVDGLIYFGDGDSADIPIKPKYPVLWALTRQNKNPFNFGRFIQVVADEKK